MMLMDHTKPHCKTSLHCWQTSDYKNLANLGAIECLQRTHFRISLHIFDDVHTSDRPGVTMHPAQPDK